MDRSAVGTNLIGTATTTTPRTQAIRNFRVQAADLAWQGDLGAIGGSGGVQLPWELGIGSIDYPNIYQRFENFVKMTDDTNPTAQATRLPPVISPDSPPDYPSAMEQPETVYYTVSVPKYQPANTTGYSATMYAFIDSSNTGTFNSGNSILGAPSTYQDVYRKFRVGALVPPDPKLEVREQLVDIGNAPHGLGEALPPIASVAGLPTDPFNPYNPSADIQQWFKPITVENDGNVNVPQISIDDNPNEQRTAQLGLFGDNGNATAPIDRTWIVSSLWHDPSTGQPLGDPYTTGSLGYVLSKARVGDPDPTVLTVPDTRKYSMDYGGTKDYLTGLGVSNPFNIKVSVRVPLSQPAGTYTSWEQRIRRAVYSRLQRHQSDERPNSDDRHAGLGFSATNGSSSCGPFVPDEGIGAGGPGHRRNHAQDPRADRYSHSGLRRHIAVSKARRFDSGCLQGCRLGQTSICSGPATEWLIHQTIRTGPASHRLVLLPSRTRRGC